MEQNKMIFRFDDVSSNTSHKNLWPIIQYIVVNMPNSQIILGVSPLAHSECGERVFPKIFNAHSDYRVHYSANTSHKFPCPQLEVYAAIGGPDGLYTESGYIKGDVVLAGHGLIHMDHRLLDYQAQEMSILVSCSLAQAKIFIPPFNKWDVNTEIICQENGIELIKFEDGWKSCEHNTFDPTHNLWYLHGYAWTLDKFKEWLCA